MTRYHFASNRPIEGIDQDGLEYLKYSARYRALVVVGSRAEKEFSFVYKSLLNANVDVVNVKDLMDLNGFLRGKGKVYDNVLLGDTVGFMLRRVEFQEISKDG